MVRLPGSVWLCFNVRLWLMPSSIVEQLSLDSGNERELAIGIPSWRSCGEFEISLLDVRAASAEVT